MNSAHQRIQLTIDDRVARVSFSRPPLNILNIAMMGEILGALNECARHRDLVSIVFEAAPDTRAFSAGVAVEEHAEETVRQMLDSFHAIFRRLAEIAKPVIAVVDGPALGGGCELVAACDIVIASERARFGLPEIKLGVFPPIAAILLPGIIGEKRAHELILTGEVIEAREALRLGLVNHVVSGAELKQKTESILARLRELSAPVLGMAKRALALGSGGRLASTLEEIEHLYVVDLMQTQDAREGIRAFMDKRTPVWRNE